MGALPKALAARGHRVMTVAPRYKEYPDAWETGVRQKLRVFNQDQEVGFFHAYHDGVDHVFIGELYEKRQGSSSLKAKHRSHFCSVFLQNHPCCSTNEGLCVTMYYSELMPDGCGNVSRLCVCRSPRLFVPWQ